MVPHLTLSEFATTPAAALKADVPPPEAMSFLVEAVAWIVPDETLHFTLPRTFPLDNRGSRPDREDAQPKAERRAALRGQLGSRLRIRVRCA